MALNFPSSPTVGDEFTGGGFTWTWTGTTWSKLAPASGSNDFTLTVGTSGNTTYVLDRPYPAGSYNITFANNDTTYDVYAIAENGTLAGYTKSGNLIVSADFSEVSILGAASDERIKFEYAGVATSPTSAGDISVAGAYITSVATSSLPNTNDSTVITGGNFAPGLEVVFTGIDSVARAAKSVTRTNSTTATAVRPDTFPTSASPFSIKVTNPGITEPTGSNRHILANAVTSGVAPTWVTGASLSQIFPNAAATITLVATDADGGPITYSLISGTIPVGMTLNSTTGVISGTPTNEATYVFTIRATDRENFYVDREFTVLSARPAGQQEFASTGSFTVPLGVTSVSAVAVGAGGLGGNGGGSGNYAHGTSAAGGSLRYVNNITVTPGETLTVTVGANNSATTIARGGTILVSGAGGRFGTGPAQSGTTPGTPNYYGTNVGTGGDGGNGGSNNGGYWARGAGGGGAGGYTGNGGNGANADPQTAATAGSGGGGGGGGGVENTGRGGRGGGVGLLGLGSSGALGALNSSGGTGNNGGDGSASTGGEYGGGGGGVSGQYNPSTAIAPLSGGARIIWGSNRSYPSTGTGNV